MASALNWFKASRTANPSIAKLAAIRQKKLKNAPAHTHINGVLADPLAT